MKPLTKKPRTKTWILSLTANKISWSVLSESFLGYSNILFNWPWCDHGEGFYSGRQNKLERLILVAFLSKSNILLKPPRAIHLTLSHSSMFMR